MTDPAIPSRRSFLKALIPIGIVAVGIIWHRMTNKRRKFLQAARRIVLIPMPLPPGISFIESVIINNTGAKPLILSAHCTHLGCAINTIKDGNLICPCHGSVFGPDGSVRKGPAPKNLHRLPYEMDRKANQIIVQLSK